MGRSTVHYADNKTNNALKSLHNKLRPAASCFLKKSQKTPKKELELGQKLKQEYFNFKQENSK